MSGQPGSSPDESQRGVEPAAEPQRGLDPAIEPQRGIDPAESQRGIDTAAESQPDTDPQPGTDPQVRRRQADRATRGGLAVLLCLEAFVVLLVPRAIAQTAEGLSVTKTVLLVGLAVALVGCAVLLRRPWGIGLGSAPQLVLAATVVLIPSVAVVVVMFVLLWLYLLRTRRIWLGSARGWRMLIS